MKAASSRTRTRKFLAFAATSLAAVLAFGTPTAHADDFTYPEGYPKLGAKNEIEPGHNLKHFGSSYGYVQAMLFTVHTSPAKEGNIKAYCIEFDVNIQFGSDLKVGSWKEFPGTNKFKDNPEVQAKVAWIAQNSYPQTDLAEVAKAAGIQGLTAKDAITATQAAIWHFTNDFEYKGLDGTDQATADRVGALYNYLISEKNVGLKETAKPTVEIKGENGTFKAGDPVGPIRFESNQATVKLTNELKYDLVDKDGKAVDKNAVPTGTDLFLKVPADAPAGEQEFKVSATGSVYAGKLLISKGTRSQTIIIGSNKEVTVEASAVLKWNAVPKATTPAPTPTPSPTPSNSTPAPKPSKSEPSTPKPGTPKKPGLPRTGTF